MKIIFLGLWDGVGWLWDHLKFFLQSPHWAEFPEEGGLPVLSDRLHCLQRSTPQLLHLTLSEEKQPDENLHMLDKFYLDKL